MNFTILHCSTWRTSLLQIAIGIPVTFTLLAWAFGDAQRVLALVAISAACTLGGSLVVWLPLWWLVGWLSLAVYQAIASHPGWQILPLSPPAEPLPAADAKRYP